MKIEKKMKQQINNVNLASNSLLLVVIENLNFLLNQLDDLSPTILSQKVQLKSQFALAEL